MFNGWINVKEKLPDTQYRVLVLIKTTYNSYYITVAEHVGYHEVSTEDYGWEEVECNTEYDEEKDCYWIPECWYESNFIEDNINWMINECEGTVVCWQNLPNALYK
jgi:hypothetical protein